MTRRQLTIAALACLAISIHLFSVCRPVEAVIGLIFLVLAVFLGLPPSVAPA